MDPGSDLGVTVQPGISLPERYQPIRRIARGGMASVWCARDRTLDRNVAIKLLADPYANDELAGRRFTREARTAARLSGHPNVVRIYDVGRALPSNEVPSGRPFIVMEHLAGGTAADALRTGALDQQTILTWLRQVAGALDYAHRRGVIHRDVKLSNFLLDLERVLHVADFGIAQLGTEDTLGSTGEVIGTAAYLAPERALGLPATESSDRYALAVAAFELLVGERPFTSGNFAAQARQHVEEPPPRASRRNPALPPAIDPVLARGMSKRQEERFASAAELVDAIGEALSRPRSNPAPAPSAPPDILYPRRSRARIAAVAALAAMILGVAIAAAAALLPGSSSPRLAATRNALYARHRNARPARVHPPLAARKQPQHAQKPHPAAPASTVASPPPPQAASLEAEGHQLMVGGDYQSAIPVLRQAVASTPRSSLTYAYALFDLGRSLRLAGDPRAAVPILWQRLQIPNQTTAVRDELTLALEALGQTQASRPPSAGSSQGGAAGGSHSPASSGGGGLPPSGPSQGA